MAQFGRLSARPTQAGVNGAEPGIVMLAEPKSGTSYRQELASDVAEDMARVLGLEASVSQRRGLDRAPY
jgi:hypothetical protein